MKIYSIVLFALIYLFISGCSTSTTGRELKDYMSSYLSDNEDVVVFGSADLKTILTKTDYKSFDKLGDVVESQLEELEGAMDMDQPIFYSLNGPFDVQGNPRSVTMLMRVEDEEKLEKKLTKMGYDINEGEGYKYTEDGDMMLGIRGDLALIVIEGGNREAKTELAKHFERVDRAPSNDQVNEILEEEGDILFGVSMANVYHSSPEKDKLTEEEQKKLASLVNNSYSQTTVRFNDGVAIIESKNRFNEELGNKMFLKSESNTTILKELGSGNARAGFSINLDLTKMEALVTDFSPEAIDELGGTQLAMIKMFSGAKSLDDLLTGKAAFIMYGDPDEYGSLEPEFSAFVGLREKGEKLGSMAESLLGDSQGFKSNKDGMSFSTQMNNTATKLSLPKGAEDFGKSGISFFINLEGLDPDEMADMTDMDGIESILKVSRFISFDFGNEGGQVKIIAKEGKENILKQLVKVHVDDLMENVGNISF